MKIHPSKKSRRENDRRLGPGSREAMKLLCGGDKD
ncbi:Serine/threonine-protein kinase SMU1 (fragment) [Bradyrhizobium sp. ORS 375]